jgi:transposase
MESTRAAVPVVTLAPEPEVGAKRRRRSVQERRRIVEETLAPGASVARVARAHGVNANQVFYWRTLYRRGQLGAPSTGNALLPVRIAGDAAEVPTSESAPPSQFECESTPHPVRHAAEPGAIHIQLPNAQLRVEGAVDASTLRAVLEMLRG